MTAGSGGPANLDAPLLLEVRPGVADSADIVARINAQTEALAAEVKRLRGENERLERECYERSIEQQDAVAAVERLTAGINDMVAALYPWVRQYMGGDRALEIARRALDPGAEPEEQR